MSQYSRCLSNERSGERLTNCLPFLKELCEQSPVRIIKTIRLGLQHVKHLLDVLPGLKIVHLVRDPRATLNSQSHFGKCRESKGGWQGCASALCERLEDNLFEMDQLIQKYPGRLMTVLYQQIAGDPIQMSKKLFDFIGTEFTKDAEEYIFNITLAGKSNNCQICTTRSNATEHIFEWKSKMRREVIDIIQERCHYLLKRYGFEII